MYSLDLCITDKCNQQCPHCYVDPKNSKDDLSTQEILDLLTESSELGAQNFHVFGGEPFLRDDLEEIFEYAYDLNFTLSIATNGSHLEPKDFDWIQKFNPFIGITLHGPKQFHDSFCKQEGNYDKAFHVLKTATKMDVNVGVITCLTKPNYQAYFPWMKSLVELGVRTFFVLYFSPLGRGKEKSEFQLLNNEWNDIFQTLKDYLLNSRLPLYIHFERSLIPKGTYPLFYYRPPVISCALYTKSNCVVDSNGDIYPCILYLRNPEFLLGNFKINSLTEIWSRFKPETMVKLIERSKSCLKCEFVTSCSGGCPAYYRAGLDFRCDEKNIPLCPLYTELL